MARQKLEVGEEKISSITITFGRGASISGRVIAASAGANPLDQLQVNLTSVDEDNEGGFAWSEVKKDGSF